MKTPVSTRSSVLAPLVLLALIAAAFLLVAVLESKATWYVSDDVHYGHAEVILSPGDGRTFPPGTEIHVVFLQENGAYVLKGRVGKMLMLEHDQATQLWWEWASPPFATPTPLGTPTRTPTPTPTLTHPPTPTRTPQISMLYLPLVVTGRRHYPTPTIVW